MNRREKALVIAFIDEKVKADKIQMDKTNKKR